MNMEKMKNAMDGFKKWVGEHEEEVACIGIMTLTSGLMGLVGYELGCRKTCTNVTDTLNMLSDGDGIVWNVSKQGRWVEITKVQDLTE